MRMEDLIEGDIFTLGNKEYNIAGRDNLGGGLFRITFYSEELQKRRSAIPDIDKLDREI